MIEESKNRKYIIMGVPIIWAVMLVLVIGLSRPQAQAPYDTGMQAINPAPVQIQLSPTPGPEPTPQSTPEPTPRPSPYLLGGLPSIHITLPDTPFRDEDRNVWQEGHISVTGTADAFLFEDISARVRGRGNSTWRLAPEKRPLRIRFAEAQPMLGSNSVGRDWILITNHFDRSLMRNHFALYLSSLLGGLDFTPMSYFVHLYVNGEYIGVYQLTDERNTEHGRAPLVLDENPAYSGIFLELSFHLRNNADAVEGEDFFIVNNRYYDLRWPSGAEYSAYAKDFLGRVSDAIQSHDWEAVTSLIDVPSFVDFYLVQELTRNPEADRFSTFMTIRGQGDSRRLYMGPVWDFDQAIGNAQAVVSPEGAFAGVYNYWFEGLMAIPEYAVILANRWVEIRDTYVRQTLDNIYYLATTYHEDFNRNFELHQIFEYPPEWQWVNAYIIRDIDSFIGQVEHLIDWIELRGFWMDEFLLMRDRGEVDADYESQEGYTR